MFWDGVAALYRPPSFNQLFISQLELMNISNLIGTCVFSVPVPPSWLMCLICHPKLIFCVLLRNTSAPYVLFCGERPVAVLFKDLDFGYSSFQFALLVSPFIAVSLPADHFC